MNPENRTVTVHLFFWGALVAAPISALAQSPPVGIVTTLQGSAMVVHAAKPEATPLRFKDEVFFRDRITTGDNSIARILLGGKAIVTVRERSALTITELPGSATIDVSSGRVAVAVAKERMKPGESVDIVTPNAVAGIRGTVVIAEVSEGVAPTSTFTVLQGTIEVTALDPVSRQAIATPVKVGTLQSVGVAPLILPLTRTITPETAERLAKEFKVRVEQVSPRVHFPAATLAQIQQAVGNTAALVGALERQTRLKGRLAAKSESRGAPTTAARDDEGGRRDTKRNDGGTSRAAQTEKGQKEDAKGSGGTPAASSAGAPVKTGGAAAVSAPPRTGPAGTLVFTGSPPLAIGKRPTHDALVQEQLKKIQRQTPPPPRRR